ncbi:MAG: ABC1 kinase family protein [Pirellulales bacterium]|jgi:ubiquinone biosynthesis protein
MKISSIPQIYRNLNRWREILSVLSKYGLADWVSRLGLEFAKNLFKNRGGEVLARHTRETRIRLALTELGPSFIKLGQILSTRPDLVGVALAEELQQLQADVPADPPEVVRATIHRELGQPVEDLFAEFDEVAQASASIGQVHAARLRSGESVVVKVQRAGIERTVRVDLDILGGLAQLAERIPEFANYRPRATVAEFERTLRRELDFSREARHMQEFARDFADDPTVHIPQAYPRLSTSRVLTMERLEGIRLSESERLRAAGFDLAEVARRGARLFLEMIFTHGFYHADPHPGNIVLLGENVIGLMDYGMVGRIDERLREDIEEMLLAIGNRDALYLASLIMRVGAVPGDLDRAALSADVTDFITHYANQPIEELDLSSALNEMTEMIRRYKIMLPARIAMLIKVLVMLEGTSRLLCPNFSLMEVMTPYRKKMFWRRMSASRQIRRVRRLFSELEHLVDVLPGGLIEILEQVQSGRFDVHLEHRSLEPSVNRLVYGMLTSALFVGSSLMLSRETPPLLFQEYSVPGAFGCVVSMVLGLRLLRAIGKSGHLDRRG